MRRKLSKILVTGGAGFIGSEFVRQAVRRGYKVTVVDKLTYAGDLTRLNEAGAKYKFYKADICDKTKIEAIFKKEKPCFVINLAAQTHVDRSIQNASPFIETNVRGTQVLLDISKKYKIKRYLQLSTDEVYGETKSGSFYENSPLQANSPYAASKAAGDLLIKSYIRTYGLPAIIIRPCNNYGPWQFPEKLIPLAISRALENHSVPVYSRGENIREWLIVSDCATAILVILEEGKPGEIYNVGSGQEKKNIDVVNELLKILGKPQDLIKFVKDRPGHDIRYRLNCKKIFTETGWRPKVEFKDGIRFTVNWYLRHKHWLLSRK